MTGRGRGRLFRDIRNSESEGSHLPLQAAEIKDLFNLTRSQSEIYKILKNNILDAPYSKNKLRSCLESLIKNMIHDSTNTIEICKYLFVCSCFNDKRIASEVWSQFFSILEMKFKEIHSKGDQNNEDTIHNFINFFISAVHFMRNPQVPPKDDIVSAILILIERLNKLVTDDRNLYCQAVAWISSYMKNKDSASLVHQAYVESVNKIREWIVDGTGGHWATACLEAACNGGFLPTNSRPYYCKTLSRSQFYNITETSHNILIPATDKAKFNLPKLDYINYID